MDRSVLLVVSALVVSAALGTALPATAVSGPHDATVGAPATQALGSDGEASGVVGRETVDRQPARTFQQQEFDRTQYIITVRQDASARWTFRFERPLTNETERREFRAFAEGFNSSETELYANFQRDAQGLVAEGANFTGRAMTATNFSRDARIESGLNTVGVVEMSFTWRAFAVEDGDRIVVADVFEDGLYIYRDQALVIRPGDGLAFESVTPNGTLSNPDSLTASDSVTWQGERQFTDNRPQVVFGPAPTATATPTETPGAGESPAATPTPGSGSGDEPTDSGLPLGVLAGILAVVGLLAGGVWYRRRGGGSPPGSGGPPGGRGDTGTGDVAGGSAGTEPSGAGESDPGPTADPTPDGVGNVGDAGGAAAAGAGAATDAADDDSMPAPSVPDEELLSDDDRVIRMLKDHGGRMKQVKIVEDTGWSKSKVSMLLSDMEEEGTISKLRVGRENVISLAGHEPDAAGSPFDGEE
jgi:uncharacterized membrane protein